MTVGNRMVVATLALVGVFVATYLLLYKLGVMGTLACGADGGCEVVQASSYAYLMGVPVAGWGVLGYLTMFGVAMVGTQPSMATRRWVSMALLGITAAAFLASVYFSAISGLVINAWCQWCLVSASVATLAFLFALPEIRRLRRGTAEPGQESDGIDGGEDPLRARRARQPTA
jgi:uncharacterized membrane protein